MLSEIDATLGAGDRSDSSRAGAPRRNNLDRKVSGGWHWRCKRIENCRKLTIGDSAAIGNLALYDPTTCDQFRRLFISMSIWSN
ncbi:hypothetical protein PGT21_019461 [Puccinia graminis f. sp. tritici]|uniref:Uncharacterized protein n=1 Tax=Puccinia graminis f. sp. tritici TaxID=56615 RepID=A0A5B0RKI9_PUCGR|nr:hypothetical protein PGT21_019461 [Puccinia graminis f. sp. tritici]KAA1125545.1 hypothetical protein PGTUg99_017618 [Puccinia graminis f. sp. tritici]